MKDAGAETRPRVAAGWKDLDKAYNQHREFNVAAFEMISSPRWNVSASVTMPYDADHAAGPSGQPQ